MAVVGIATGLVFLWAFLDKTFGWGYATPAERAWVNGGSPTKGFLGNLDHGPLADMFRGWAGAGWADWPLDRFTDTGEPTMSTNPILDYHILYALVLIWLAITAAGNTWGLGKTWTNLDFVQKNPWLR